MTPLNCSDEYKNQACKLYIIVLQFIQEQLLYNPRRKFSQGGDNKMAEDIKDEDLKEAVECEDVHIDSYASEDEPLQVIPMTEAEEDKNAGVTRDSDNNVKGVEHGV